MSLSVSRPSCHVVIGLRSFEVPAKLGAMKSFGRLAQAEFVERILRICEVRLSHSAT